MMATKVLQKLEPRHAEQVGAKIGDFGKVMRLLEHGSERTLDELFAIGRGLVAKETVDGVEVTAEESFAAFGLPGPPTLDELAIVDRVQPAR